jgi:hypothetical protein
VCECVCVFVHVRVRLRALLCLLRLRQSIPPFIQSTVQLHPCIYQLCSSFDAAALIRQDGLPACAAVIDVHGADVAELFVVGTRR